MKDYDAVTVSTGDGRYAMELVPDFGGVLNRLTHTASAGSTELIAGFASRREFEQDRFFRGVPLYPYVNRLDGGTYRHQDLAYHFEINESGTNTSLHGFLGSIRPEIVEQHEAEEEAVLRLLYRYKGDNPGYPFPAEISLRYHLHSAKGLSLHLQVLNLHDSLVPLGLGWHPYFTLDESVDSLQLRLPPVNRVEVDARMLPVGTLQEFSRFTELQPIGGISLDTCLAFKANTSGRVSTLLWSEHSGKGIELWQDSSALPYLHVFIPPDRRSIALEPVSCGIDAFNTGENLVHLGAGKVFSAVCGVRLVQ